MKNLLLTFLFSVTLVFGAHAQFTLNDDATNISTATTPNSFQLTKTKGEKGNVWNNSKIDIRNNSFTLTFSLRFDNKVNKGSDGIGIVFQNDVRGLKTVGSVNSSQYMGFYGIQPSLNIEFDTFDDGVAAGDIAADHISISKNSASAIARQLTTAISAKANNATIEDGLDHNAEIVWDATTTTLEVYLDGSLRQTYSGNVVTDVFNGNSDVYWGITSSSGSNGKRNQVNKIVLKTTPVSKTINPLPVSLTSFEVAATEKGNVLTWFTATEKNNDYFQIERSADIKTWNNVAKVSSHINSNTLQRYSFTDKTVSGTIYYRLKMVDLDGTFKYSKIITIKSGAIQTSALNVYPNPVQNTENITLKFAATETKNAAISLLDMMGAVIKSQVQSAQIGENIYTVNTENLKPGIYIVQIIAGSTKESVKLLVK